MKNPLSPKERVKIPRQRMPEQAPSARRHNFEELTLRLKSYCAEEQLSYDEFKGAPTTCSCGTPGSAPRPLVKKEIR